MTDHPMPFSGPMVRALLEGRKTQTRRVAFERDASGKEVGSKWHKIYMDWAFRPIEGYFDYLAGRDGRIWREAPTALGRKIALPDPLRLWARESLKRGANNEVVYAADGDVHPDAEWVWQRNTLPSIYMPRGLSRFTLSVTDVKVEQLQDISEADAIAEGAGLYVPGHGFIEKDDLKEGYSNYLSPKMGFEVLWNIINGDRPGCAWADNPWVVAYRFNIIRENISRIKP